jgi:adenosylhomocysteinase
LKAKGPNYAIADLALAEAGRKQIRLAETEMPGLLAVREEFGPLQPLAGARISVSLSITVQTAVLVETLVALGASVRLASCNIFSSQDEAAAALVAAGVSVYGCKGETSEEFWWCLDQILDWSSDPQVAGDLAGADSIGPTSLLDDGGDLVYLIHQGLEFERTGELEQSKSWALWEHEIVRALLESSRAKNPERFAALVAGIIGGSEETTTGVQRLEVLERQGRLLFPMINVNDAVTKSKFDNKYGIRHSLIDGFNRATDVLIGGKTAFVAGYGDVGKGCAEALRGQGARVIIGEIDPICALQAAMDGFQVARLESVVEQLDFVITTTGNINVVGAEHYLRMKNLAILANVGHFDNEFDVPALEALAVGVTEIKPLVHEYHLSNGRSLILLSEGRVMNLGNATGHPSFVMSASFTNQAMAQIEIAQNAANLENKVYRIPKLADEKVARVHLAALGAVLTELRPDQARYIGVSTDGPYKPEQYRY